MGSVTVTGIGLNQQVPLDIDPLRFAYILAVLLALYAVRPQSVLFSRVFDGRITRQGWMVIALVAVQCVVIFILVMSIRTSCPSRTPPARRTSSSTRRLAQALLQGHFYLDDVPSAALQAMDNPYDTAARDSAGVPYLWDHAYYQGKYYVYFGVLPCWCSTSRGCCSREPGSHVARRRHLRLRVCGGHCVLARAHLAPVVPSHVDRRAARARHHDVRGRRGLILPARPACTSCPRLWAWP